MMMIITRGGEGGGGRGRGKFQNKIKQKKVDECLHLRASAGHRMRSADYPPRNRSQTHTHTHTHQINQTRNIETMAALPRRWRSTRIDGINLTVLSLRQREGKSFLRIEWKRWSSGRFHHRPQIELIPHSYSWFLESFIHQTLTPRWWW